MLPFRPLDEAVHLRLLVQPRGNGTEERWALRLGRAVPLSMQYRWETCCHCLVLAESVDCR